MKAMACDQCDKTFSADSFEDWFEQMKNHYMAAHADIMSANAGKSKEEGMAWMAEMKARFEAL